MLTISKLDLFLELVYIPGGSFMMGSPKDQPGRQFDEGPQHLVTLQPFYMSKYPITKRQYEEIFPGKNISDLKGDNLPVERVTWNDATNFCQELSNKMEGTYCLPSESQWEYACRAGTKTPYSFGDTITTELVNFDNYYKRTTEVGSFPANAFGLYDMHGNVWEWCQDDWHDNYNCGDCAPDDGSSWGNSTYGYKLLRGGCWDFDAFYCRSTNRGRGKANGQNYNIGFRVVYMPGL